MKHGCYSVFDQKAKAYLPPFFLHEQGVAVRIFGDCCNSADHQFGQHPGDYTLFDLGVFDDASGMLKAHLAPLVICNGLELVTDGKVSKIPKQIIEVPGEVLEKVEGNG